MILTQVLSQLPDALAKGFALVVLYVCAFTLAVYVNVLGKWLAARLLGIPVSDVTIGIGPVWSRGRFCMERWLLRWVPLTGHVQPRSIDATRRWAHIAMIAAGAVGNLAAAVVLSAVAPDVRWRYGLPLDPVFRPLIIFQYGIAVASAIPYKIGREKSDGYQISEWVHINRWRKSYDYMIAMRRDYSGDQSISAVGMSFVNTLAAVSRRSRDGSRVMSVSAQLDMIDAAPDLEPDEKAGLIDSVLTGALFAPDPPLEAMERGASMLWELAGETGSARATRSSVMILGDQVEKGRALLSAVVFEKEQDPVSFAIRALMLAKADLKLGDIDAARKSLIELEPVFDDSDRPVEEDLRRMFDALRLDAGLPAFDDA